MGTFVEAGEDILKAVKDGLSLVADKIEAQSLIECPTSIPPDYITAFRTIDYEVHPMRRARGPGDDEEVWSGTLRDSFQRFPAVMTDESVSITMGYGFNMDDENPQGRIAANYVLAVHERLDLLHRPPQKAKFLEDPAYAAAAEMGPIISVEIKKATL